MIAHLAACTAVALVAAAAALVLRGQRAAWRHAILFAGLMRFAMPTAWLEDAGRRMVKVAPARFEAEWLLKGPWQSLAFEKVTGRPGGPRYEGIWILGAAVGLLFWARKAWRRIPVVREASEYEAAIFARTADEGMELRIVARDLAPGAWGLRRAVVLLPDGLSMELSEAELVAVLAHEVAHIRRHDNLLAAMSHAVVAVFWFHPLVWWMERRMLAERETACDELVLARGTLAQDYASGILKACRMSFAGASGYAGVNGSNLENRMEHIMSVDLNRTSSRAARALLGVALGLVVLAPLGGGYLRAQQKPAGEQQIDPSRTARPLMVEVEDLLKRNKGDEALQRLQSELDKDPKRLDVRMALGNVAVRTGKHDLAVATFQDALAQVETGSNAAGDIYLRLGETYRRMGETGPAIAALQHAGQLLADSVVVHSTLALVLDGAGRWQEAVQQYRKTLELDPNNAVALNNLAYLLSENNGNLDEALELAQRAREALPNLTEISDTLGWIYLKKNLTGGAIDVFEELVKRDSQKSTYRYHLAMAYAQKGLKMSAVEQLKAALDCKPTQDEAEKISRLLISLQNQ